MKQRQKETFDHSTKSDTWKSTFTL